MATLYQIDGKGSLMRLKDGDKGPLRKEMNSLRQTNKGTTYAIYEGNTLHRRVG